MTSVLYITKTNKADLCFSTLAEAMRKTATNKIYMQKSLYDSQSWQEITMSICLGLNQDF